MALFLFFKKGDDVLASEGLLNAIRGYENYINSNGIDENVIDAYIMAAETAISREKDIDFGLKTTARCKEIIEEYVFKLTGGTIWDLEKYCFDNKVSYAIIDKWYSALLPEAQNMVLDSYLRYLERKREPKDRFYEPKRKQFLKIGLIQSLQDMLDDKLDILSISLPPGTGKTTMEKFLNSGIMGWFPKDFNLFYSHSGDITRMYYDGVLDILTNTDEYTWHDIFPDLSVTNTNAKMEQLNIGKYKPFPNLQCTSVGSKNAGKVRCNKFLLCDDLIGGIEEALNKNRLDNLWNVYSVDARQRKIPGCKEIHIATRWSVHDVIGRLQRLYADSDRVRFIAVPDIDPDTGESNFEFDFNGFDTGFFHDQELAMDEISYKCLYKNEPIEREGLLYHEDDLRRYLALPLENPDAVIGICDTKDKGTDYYFLPCCYVYGDDYYCVDCICDNGSDYGVQYQRSADLIINNKMQKVEFEHNSGGGRVAYDVSKIIEEKHCTCNITSKQTTGNKETKIIVNADWVKKHVLFRDKSMYSSRDDYGRMMSLLLSYSVAGKNATDDVPDGFAMLAEFVNRAFGAQVTGMANPFWGLGG